MALIALRRSPAPRDRRPVWVEAVVSMTLLALAWGAIGWMGFVLTDPGANDTERVVAVAAAAVYQGAAILLLLRSWKRGR